MKQWTLKHKHKHVSLSDGVMICGVSPCVLLEQEKTEVAQKRDVEGMGAPEIKYGESMCFVQHIATGLWLTYASVDAKSARLGPVKRKVTRTLIWI